MSSTITHHLYTAHTRPDLWDHLQDPNHPLNTAWPYFLERDQTLLSLSSHICKFQGLRKFQYVISERNDAGDEELVACGRSIPFFWHELRGVEKDGGLDLNPRLFQSLPDGGWDTMVARGIRQYMACHPEEAHSWPWSSAPITTEDQERDTARSSSSEPPNALSALAVTVRADRRRMGLAERILQKMKDTARQEGLRILVVPLRPTKKSSHPFVPMEEYIKWTQAPLKPTICRTPSPFRVTPQPIVHSITIPSKDHATKSALPFDPWLRKHARMGAKIAKVAHKSMEVEASLDDWTAWTGIEFDSFPNAPKVREVDGKLRVVEYTQVTLQGGLVPLKVYREEKRAVYLEPNVWIYHQLD
ncbi:hypothetical protein CEP54_011026 [Fusarium duplospermum]|uniref:Uncharacterized protein n=1 Tax=Fusarium duplospermum TaxID=1325734 RepID=A0A428PGY4_9HYPO|nr:hypothetical protein CEP54_011026 [Fusarium duplospermum]